MPIFVSTVGQSTGFNTAYLRTLPGMLKVTQIVANLIGFICITASSKWTPSSSLFGFVASVGFFDTGFILIIYLLYDNFFETGKYCGVPIAKAEVFYCTLWALLNLIAAILVITNSMGAAGVFGALATLAYAFDAFLKYRMLTKQVEMGSLDEGNQQQVKS